jgi:hypothetical protein
MIKELEGKQFEWTESVMTVLDSSVSSRKLPP